MTRLLIPLLLISSSMFGQSSVVFSGSVSDDIQDQHIVLECISAGNSVISSEVGEDGNFAIRVPVGTNSTVVFSATGHSDLSVVINTENIRVDVSGYYAKQTFLFEIELEKGEKDATSSSPSHYLYFSQVKGDLCLFEAREKVSEIARLFEED